MTQAARLAEVLSAVRRIEVESARPVAEVMAGAYASVFKGAGVEFDDVREYEEGDDPRAVDWNVTARVGRPFVKKYVDERQLTVLFLLDLSASMTAGTGGWSPREAAARVVACLGLSAARNHDKVGLVAFGPAGRLIVPPRKGLPTALRIVRDALFAPDLPGGADAAGALRFAARAVRKRAVAFLITDGLALPDVDALRECARRHDLVAVRVSSPELVEPPAAWLRVLDPETGATSVFDGAHRPARDEYAARIKSWRAASDAAFRAAKVEVVDVRIPRAPTPDAVAGPLVGFFRRRAARARHR